MNRFVVIEGLDGAGTTTQAQRLAAHLARQGQPVLATREPTAGPIGRIIRQTLAAEPEAPDVRVLPWLFAADRADHLHRTVEPALARGEVVVSDRYYHSSLAYQALTLPLERVHALNADFRVPDVTVFLDVPVAECVRRIGARELGREIYEEEEELERISASYQRVLAFLRERGEPVVVVDGHRDADAVGEDVARAVR